MAKWKPQAWRSDPKSVCLETNVGTFTVNWNGGTGWRLGWLNSYLEGNITIDECLPTDTIARNAAEYIVMSRRQWYEVITEPPYANGNSVTPISLLQACGYKVSICSDAPNYAEIVQLGLNKCPDQIHGKYLCQEAMDRFVGPGILDYRSNPNDPRNGRYNCAGEYKMPPAPWAAPVATSGFVATTPEAAKPVGAPWPKPLPKTGWKT